MRIVGVQKSTTTIHFDDGDEALFGLPDPTIEILLARVQSCTCPRCTLLDPRGKSLPTCMLSELILHVGLIRSLSSLVKKMCESR